MAGNELVMGMRRPQKSFHYSEGLRPHAVDPIYHARVERGLRGAELCRMCPAWSFSGGRPEGASGHGDGARGRVTVSAVRAPPDCAVGKWETSFYESWRTRVLAGVERGVWFR